MSGKRKQSDNVQDIPDDDLKSEKTREEIQRLKIQNGIASKMLVDRREVITQFAETLSSLIESMTTIADDLSNDLSNSDAALVHEQLSRWSRGKLQRICDELRQKASEARNG